MKNIFSTFPTAGISNLPTPIKPLKQIGKTFEHDHLFIKQDNLSSSIYGGNKIRKLEFLLGEALAENRKAVITYGATGSNHALATAVSCRKLGLNPISILCPQKPTDHVQKNLLMQQAVGAELILCPNYTDFPQATRIAVQQHKLIDGIEPYIIPAGGTNAIGSLGFVQAALELAKQIPDQLPAVPDVIYIPMGTGGTHAGLLVGLKLAGLETRVEGIRVVDPEFRNETHIKQLCDDLCTQLQIKPIINESDIIIRNEFFGDGYGMSTFEAKEAVHQFKQLENIYLETTYTGKAVAALLQDLQSGALKNQTVLYWNTLNSQDFSAEIAILDFHELPKDFHNQFTS